MYFFPYEANTASTCSCSAPPPCHILAPIVQVCPPSDRCSDLREEAVERLTDASLRSMRQWGAFLGAGDDLGGGRAAASEDTLRASSDSPSVRPASSLELDSGLLTQEEAAALRGAPSQSDPWSRGRAAAEAAALRGAALAELFCSEECEDSDSMLPIGVLPGLLLKASPMQGPAERTPSPH